MSNRIQILDKEGVSQKIERLAWQVYEHNSNQEILVVVGISSRGLNLAQQLANYIEEISRIKTIVKLTFANFTSLFLMSFI